MKFWFDTLKSRLLLTLVTGVLFTRDGLSFDALGKVDVSAPVIFTTAYDEYAVRAFKYNGIDYLLKPVDADELASAVARAVKMRTSAMFCRKTRLLTCAFPAALPRLLP